MLIALIVTPVTARLLGKDGLGIWILIREIARYIGAGGFRVAETLKYQIAVLQHVDDPLGKRRKVGTAVLAVAIAVPILGVVLAVVIWQLPAIFEIRPEMLGAAREAMFLTGLSVILHQIIGIPAAAVRGENVDYRAFWLRSLAGICSALLGLFLLYQGWGLVGLGVGVFAGSFFLFGYILWMACRFVPWFGVARPNPSDLREYGSRTGWVLLGSLGWIGLSTVDLFIVGAVLSPESAATYKVTGSLIVFLLFPMTALISAANPGVAGLIGAGRWLTIRNVKREFNLYNVLAAGLAGAVVLRCNADFVATWMTSKYFGGSLLTLLFVVQASLTNILQSDINILDGLLEFKKRSVLLGATTLGSVACSVVGAKTFGLPGAVVGPLLGRICVSLIFTRWIISSPVGGGWQSHYPVRLMITVAVIWVAILMVPGSGDHRWISLFAQGSLTAALTAPLLFFLGLGRIERQLVVERFLDNPKIRAMIPERLRRLLCSGN